MRKIKRRPPTKINRDFLKRFESRLQNALSEIGDEMGLVLKTKGMTFTESSFSGRYEAHIKGGMPKTERDYIQRNPHLGLPPLFTVIVINGKPYKIVGWRTRATKRPILLERNGKNYTATVLQIQKGTQK
jgi:hypothetical protein